MLVFQSVQLQQFKEISSTSFTCRQSWEGIWHFLWMNADVKKHVEIDLNPQEAAVKQFSCRHLELLITLRILNPPMETLDPPNDTPGALKQMVFTPHDIPWSLKGNETTSCNFKEIIYGTSCPFESNPLKFFNHRCPGMSWNSGSKSWSGLSPPKTNMEPKNGGLQDDFPFQTGDFQVPC